MSADAPAESTLEALLRARLGRDELVPGARVDLGNLHLCVREVSDDGVEVVGLQILA